MKKCLKQERLDEFETLRVEAAAKARLSNFDPAQAISHDDMRARYAQETLTVN
ncbi:hypothetical protein [Pseudomonas sp. PSE1(2024)]|uniref:hypothetical protein n=1 Tax=Pseudomonas sp. PSE1(2024) TaxID=3228746 RepID=UPI003D976C0E